MRRVWPRTLTVAGITLVTAIPAAASASPASAAAAAPPEVRVNQVGYPSSGPKAAFVMLAKPVRKVSFEITTSYGVAYRGSSADEVGSWNSAYRAVYQLNFSGVRLPGTYQVTVVSPAAAVSPAFSIGSGPRLYRQLVDNAVRYFTSERDGPDVDPAVLDLLDDLAAQLRTGEDWAKGDPFALGAQLGPADASPHAFGLFITNALYQEYGGSGRYRSFAQQQLNFALGANAWGSSFVVGAGAVFPHCMQSEIANLAGSLTGAGGIQLGATTDGPSSPANFAGLDTVPGMRACGAGNFAPFNTKTAGYEDNVVSWPSVEPADDYTAAGLLAFALGGNGLG